MSSVEKIRALGKIGEPLLNSLVYKPKSLKMFGLFKKNPVAGLEKKYKQLMEEAMELQRSGDIKAYALKVDEAEGVLKEIERLQQSDNG